MKFRFPQSETSAGSGDWRRLQFFPVARTARKATKVTRICLDLEDSFDESLRKIQKVQLFVVTRRRNAWHQTTNTVYKSDPSAALHSSMRAAARAAERWRKQGSAFAILEVPGLLLYGDQSRVALTEFHSKNPFSGWNSLNRNWLRRGSKLRQAEASLSRDDPPRLLESRGVSGHRDWKHPRPSAYSFLSVELKANERPAQLRPRAEFLVWESVAVGTEYLLDWNSKETAVSARGVNAVLKHYREVNRPSYVSRSESSREGRNAGWNATS